MARTTRWGPQPALELLRRQKRTITDTYQQLGIEKGHFYRAIHGDVIASDEMRDRLAELLGVPVEELFTKEILERKYGGPRGRNGGTRKKPVAS